MDFLTQGVATSVCLGKEKSNRVLQGDGSIGLETDMRRNELPWVHDVVGIQSSLYSFHCP